MNIIEFIKENSEALKSNNIEFKANIAPKISEWSSVLNTKITNTLGDLWSSRFLPFDEDLDLEAEEAKLSQCSKAEKMYLDLKQQLGQETFVGQWYTIDQNCINQFADVTSDHQWVHTDPVRASQESPFKTTIAHGFLTLSLIPTLTDIVGPTKSPYPGAKMMVNYGLNKVRFPYPVKSGSRVRARMRLIDLSLMKRSIEVVNEVTVAVENSRRPGCIAETVLRLYF